MAIIVGSFVRFIQQPSNDPPTDLQRNANAAMRVTSFRTDPVFGQLAVCSRQDKPAGSFPFVQLVEVAAPPSD